MSEIERACEILGSQRALASFLGISPVTVHQWCTEDRPVPLGWCPRIEEITKGFVCCEDLRPDVAWIRIKDKSWPHIKGRPLVDYSRFGRQAKVAA